MKASASPWFSPVGFFFIIMLVVGGMNPLMVIPGNRDCDQFDGSGG